MLNRLALPLALLFLAGCPTPPETTAGGGNTPGQPGGGGPGEGGGPGGPPPGGEGGGPPPGGGGGAGGPGGGGAAGGPPAGSMGFMKFDMDIPPEGAPKMSQEEIAAGDHVTLSGTVVCTDCSEALVVRVMNKMLQEGELTEPPPEPGDEKGELPGPLTSRKLSAAGEFSVVVPKGNDAVIVEILVDADGNGVPSKGDRAASTEDGKSDAIVPSEDRSGIEIDASDRDWTPPSAPGQGGGGGGGGPTPPQEGGAGGAPPDGPPPEGGGAPPDAPPPEDGAQLDGPPGPPPEGGAPAGGTPE